MEVHHHAHTARRMNASVIEFGKQLSDLIKREYHLK